MDQFSPIFLECLQYTGLIFLFFLLLKAISFLANRQTLPYNTYIVYASIAPQFASLQHQWTC